MSYIRRAEELLAEMEQRHAERDEAIRRHHAGEPPTPPTPTRRRCSDLDDNGDPCLRVTAKGKRRCRTHHAARKAERDRDIETYVAWLDRELKAARERIAKRDAG